MKPSIVKELITKTVELLEKFDIKLERFEVDDDTVFVKVRGSYDEVVKCIRELLQVRVKVQNGKGVEVEYRVDNVRIHMDIADNLMTTAEVAISLTWEELDVVRL